jgi:protein-disulfide isomerase
VVDLPLESIHKAAFRGAEMVRCAGEQGKFWEMRTRLFSNPQTLEDTASHASALRLDGKRFDTCMASEKFAADIKRDQALAEQIGVQGTPTFFLAVTDSATGKLKPVRLMSGARPFASFQTLIDAALADAK